MRVCSRCGTSYGDAERFCALDGAALQAAATLFASKDAPTLKMRVRGGCDACGEALANDGEGYCRVCGYRLEPDRDGAKIAVEGGLQVGVFEILAAAGDEMRVRDTRLAEDHPRSRADLVIGPEASVALEAEALVALAAEGIPCATIIERGIDARRGSFLVLSPPPEGALVVSAVIQIDLAAGLSYLTNGAAMCAALESQRFAFRPTSLDLYVAPGGKLWLRRVRGVRRIPAGERLDAGPLFHALGDPLLPLPMARATSELVHLVSMHAPALGDTRVTVEEALRRIADARRSPGGPYGANVSATPPDATRSGLSIDQGMRRDHNEDAAAYAEGIAEGKPGTRPQPWATLVVCDGVSASTHADEASKIASKTTSDALAHFVTSGDIAFESSQNGMAQAIRAAHVGICAFAAQLVEDEPPGTTIVAALLFGPRLTVGWVGDSRAYWVTETGAELLTHDHSWVNETVERGEMTEAQALQQPLAHALTRCLGPLESRGGPIMVTPDVISRVLRTDGHLVLCSDGLWNYYPAAEDIASLVHEAQAAGETSPNAIARYLLNHALAAGGQDNVTVLVHAFQAQET